MVWFQIGQKGRPVIKVYYRMAISQEQLTRENTEYQTAKSDFLKRAEGAQHKLQEQRDSIMQQRIDLRIKESEFMKQKEDDCALVLKRNAVSFLFCLFFLLPAELERQSCYN